MDNIVKTEQSSSLEKRTEPSTALAASDQARAIAEVQAAMAIAKRFPRDQIQSLDRIQQMCARPALAESALYEYSRGGSKISGPSIRLAEAIAQCWGNIQFGIRELEQRDGESIVEAYAWDLETNTRASKVFQQPHLRHTRERDYRLTDPRDVYELVANNGARRLRACILNVIPGDVVEAAVDQCARTLVSKVDLNPERIKAMVDKFAEKGITKEQIEERIQRRLESITPALFLQLVKIFNSISDGMSKPDEWFKPKAAPEAEGATKTEKLKNELKGKGE